MSSARKLFFDYLAQTSPEPLALEFKKGKGIYLYDQEGKKYIDMISGISVSNLGHGNKRIIEAVKSQAESHMHLMVYGEFIQSPQIELANKLINMLPKELEKVYFVNSGSEAVEGAIKLAKRYTGRYEIIAFKNAYHGGTHGALSVTGNESIKSAFRPLLPNIIHLDFNNFNDLSYITEKTACVIIEPVQAEAGVITPEKGFLQELRNKCTKTGSLLIFDEIQTGIGRTGKMFAFQHENITPDILLLGKAFGGGMPLAAFVSSSDIMVTLSNNPALGHITTFGGHPVCCSAALASLEEIERLKLIDKVESKNNLIINNLKHHKEIIEIRHAGLMIALDLGSSTKVLSTVKKCIDKGLITDWFLFNAQSLRLAPPLIIDEEEINAACDILTQCI